MTKFNNLNLFKEDYYTVIIDHYMCTKKDDNMIMEQFHHDKIANVNTSNVKSFYNKLYSSLHKNYDKVELTVDKEDDNDVAVDCSFIMDINKDTDIILRVQALRS